MKLIKKHIGATVTRKDWLSTYTVLDVTKNLVVLKWLSSRWVVLNDGELIVLKNKGGRK